MDEIKTMDVTVTEIFKYLAKKMNVENLLKMEKKCDERNTPFGYIFKEEREGGSRL